MVIQAMMENYEVRKVLVDQGNSVDIMIVDLLAKLGTSMVDLTLYRDRKTPPVLTTRKRHPLYASA